MVLKQNLNSVQAPDGSSYVTLTDGAGNLASTVTSGGGVRSLATAFGTSGADGVSNSNGAGIQDDATVGTFGRSLIIWNYIFNGTTWDRLRGDITGLWVGNEARTTNKTAASNAGTVRPIATTVGAAVNKPYQVPELDWSFASAAGGIINTSDNVLIAAAGAGIRNYLTGITIQNASATISTEVVIKDGATIIWRGFVGTSALLNSAVGVSFPSPLKTTANTALNVACITTAAAVYVNAQGYQAP